MWREVSIQQQFQYERGSGSLKPRYDGAGPTQPAATLLQSSIMGNGQLDHWYSCVYSFFSLAKALRSSSQAGFGQPNNAAYVRLATVDFGWQKLKQLYAHHTFWCSSSWDSLDATTRHSVC